MHTLALEYVRLITKKSPLTHNNNKILGDKIKIHNTSINNIYT